MDPLRPINKALCILQKIERQKQNFDAVDMLSEAQAYNTSNVFDISQPDSKKPRLEGHMEGKLLKHCSHCNQRGHVVADCYKLKDCTYCGRKGHARDSCYKLKGFPDQRAGRVRGRGSAIYKTFPLRSSWELGERTVIYTNFSTIISLISVQKSRLQSIML
ncbi:hypothetical protein RND81_02G083100 [Saponaria officinalis]|uniref:CCHC-type domain-containing protein n=1 Tax=Saponaria officinalis TaxID=3572 RepID=A0AAW1MSA8_SAPOF